MRQHPSLRALATARSASRPRLTRQPPQPNPASPGWSRCRGQARGHQRNPSARVHPPPPPPPLAAPHPRAVAFEMAAASKAALATFERTADPTHPQFGGWGVVAVALVAVVFLGAVFFGAGGGETEVRALSVDVELLIHRATGEGQHERLLDGATARDGDILTFEIRLGQPAYAMVIGTADRAEPGAVWPLNADAATTLPLSSGIRQLNATHTLPRGGVQARWIAVSCVSPHTVGRILGDVQAAAGDPAARIGTDCTQSSVGLRQLASGH